MRVGAEDGLLGLAFAPDYAQSRLFYVMYNDRAGDVQLAEFKRSARNHNRAVRGSERTLLTIEKFSAMHNGGMLQFGRDGHLYVGVGDGGESDTFAAGQFAQDLGSLFGKILRLDPAPAPAAPYSVPSDNPFTDMPGARPEIWAYGLRNPWRFWLDTKTNALLIGDVGALAKEEVDYAKGAGRGLNFGWPCFEGTSPFDAAAVCENAVAPLLDYGHGKRRCAVVGGVTVADPRLTGLRGQYLYTDVCSQALRAVRVKRGRPVGDRALKTPKLGLPVSLGTDGRQRIYVATFTGSVWRVDPPRSR